MSKYRNLLFGKIDIIRNISSGPGDIGFDDIATVYYPGNISFIKTSDFDGDGKADHAIRRPSDKHFYVKQSSNDEVTKKLFN